MPFPTVPSPGGPITQVPYDILMEIFTHCLPQSSAERHWGWRDVNTKIAPILLCHICSSWRKLVLESASLWTHLSCEHCFTRKTCKTQAFTSPSLELGTGVIKFIRWWKIKQRRIPPVLSLCHGTYDVWDVRPKITGHAGAFLLEYITSAQYLDIDISYCFWIHEKIKAGDPVVFSNLHTALIIHNRERDNFNTIPFYQIQTLLPADAFPALRRLFIMEPKSLHDFIIPTHWSMLTHLSLDISITPVFWLSLIRAVPRLQFGCFDLAIGATHSLSSIDTDTPLSFTRCVLPDLTMLAISLRCTEKVRYLVPLSFLFTRLHLPAVRTLALSAPDMIFWENHHLLRDLYTVISATPAVTTLALEYTCHWYDCTVETPTIALPPTTEPIWAHAPKVAHLQLALPLTFMGTEELEDVLPLFVRHIFSAASIWLDLQNPACPIRAITINDKDFARPISEPTMASVRESAGKMSEVRSNVFVSPSARATET
ncbi:hypothetical protein BJ912DRAFT_995466 [Pholiota molesta]|nr:hypothetical protein BJ912DRAFT_995466 [Pholiota molesta]